MESWETPRLEEQMKSEFIEDQKEEAREASKKKKEKMVSQKPKG